jgi:hypothetical protein
MSLLFTVRDLSDDEVRAATTFWSSMPGRTLSRACRDAVLGAIEAAQERAADALRPTPATSARR